ncbi:dihydrodipicolinate synthase family protein [Actinomycetospora sp. TBRC 11914]|uniref:dihydrodipicolinate synthase family protein n=1 Tax=Actinomycetospora sp. TBRC 11914 TaxID=2729387 RepID=UPI00145CE7AA|nr:dihydrodipicolinate synthase family protein [Actinomycetospora sp. TBRC 11914]NMO93139.1 dihydrodipicolinate synthase family protein [Actinomycetospora sp. TBRC 11914]
MPPAVPHAVEPTLAPGLVVAALTTFRGDSVRVDQARLADQVTAVAGYAPSAISVGAVESQEFQVLARRTRLAMLDTVVAAAPGVPVVAGVSSPSLAESIALTREAARRGASLALAVASPKPWGAAPTPDEAHRWFSLLADASPIPLMLYNNPRLGVDLSVDTMARICSHPQVAGIKETSRDEAKLLGLIARVAEHAAVFTNMEMLLATLVLGGAGAMLPTPGVPIAARIVAAVRDGDHRRAAADALFFADFPSRWNGLGFLPAVKAAAALMGCDLGGPLWPWSGLDETARADLAAHLAKWDLLDHFATKDAPR